MYSQIKSYFKFLLNATNQHGVHSPFVFNLITKCFYKKTPLNKRKRINSYRNDLMRNKGFIEVTDFGKGSRVFKSKNRAISKIAKIAGISKKRAELLARVVAYLNLNEILETGTSLGIGTASMAIGNPQAHITTLEGCKNTSNFAIGQFEKFNLKNINVVIGEFSTTLPISLKNKNFDLIYFDGNHKKEPTLDYFHACLKNIHNESVFVFDDIHWSGDMEDAWSIIKKHPLASVTIDTYYWGFVFFRKEQIKEHFTIRI